MTTEISYSTSLWGTRHHYQFRNGEVLYRSDDSNIEYRFALKGAKYTIRPKRRFHRFWYAGWFGVVFPLYVFGDLYTREDTIDFDGFLWFQVGFFILGVFLLILYCKPAKGYDLKSSSGDLIWIISDPTQPGSAEQLAQAIASYASPESVEAVTDRARDDPGRK